mgnify:CR=1 FL=1
MDKPINTKVDFVMIFLKYFLRVFLILLVLFSLLYYTSDYDTLNYIESLVKL